MTAPRALQISVAFSVVMLSSCCQGPANLRHGDHLTNENLNAVLWKQTSAEYRALAEQAYSWARNRLDTALESRAWTAALEQVGNYSELPPAVIVDIDETALDTSTFQARLAKSGRPFELGPWNDWVRQRKSRAVPGALDFVRYAASKGVRIFYVTNRGHDVEDATRQNLSHLGFPVDPDGENLLTRNERAEWASDKASRRAFIARTHRILLIVGDDLRDFVPGAKTTIEKRAEMVSQYRSYWGQKWIVIPNPAYGSWERALYDNQLFPRRERLRRKYERLNPQEE